MVLSRRRSCLRISFCTRTSHQSTATGVKSIQMLRSRQKAVRTLLLQPTHRRSDQHRVPVRPRGNCAQCSTEQSGISVPWTAPAGGSLQMSQGDYWRCRRLPSLPGWPRQICPRPRKRSPHTSFWRSKPGPILRRLRGPTGKASVRPGYRRNH